MRLRIVQAFVIAVALGFISTPLVSAGWSVGASVDVDTGLFYSDLAPYGNWVDVASYGWVWTPRVGVSWRPYSDGHWVWTDDNGWLWVSNEDYGWAVYHYGRWDLDPSYGWIWVPGYEWGPAWVSWRHGDGYVGWAPLTPQIGFEAGVGFSVGGGDFDRHIDVRHYNFVPERSFLEGNVSRAVLPVGRNETIVGTTRNVTNYSVSGSRVVNRGVSVAQVQRFTGQSVPRLHTQEVRTLGDAHSLRANRDSVSVFRPNVRKAENLAPPAARSQAQPTEKEQKAVRKVQQQQLVRARQDREQKLQQLENRQAFERKDLEKLHQKEIQKPPRGVSAAELDQRHQQEHSSLAAQQHQQNQTLQARLTQPHTSPQRTAQASPHEAPQHMAQVAPHEPPQHKAQVTPHEPSQHPAQVAPHEAPQHPAQVAPHAAPQHNAQAAPHPSPAQPPQAKTRG